MNILITLFAASFFSKVALYTFIFLLSTLLLPAKPLRWLPMNRHYILRTWRQYFRCAQALNCMRVRACMRVPACMRVHAMLA